MRLRERVLQGGAYLSFRHGVGMGVGLVGIVLLTRLLGPAQYGLYAAALGIFLYLQALSQWGVDVYLVRREGEDDPRIDQQAQTLLLLFGLAGTGLGVALLPALVAWMQWDGFRGAATVLFLALPLSVLARVPMARLERALDFKRVALVELGGQALYFAVAIALAVRGWGVWAPVTGWWIQQALVLVVLHRLAGVRPRLVWDRAMIREMLGYGLGYSAAQWAWQLRVLVNPLVVGRLAGPDGVGYVALAVRMVEVLSFVRTASWRLSIAALARVKRDSRRLMAVVNEGMKLQVLALAPLLVLFAWGAPVLVPALFGEEWRPVVTVFPFIALGCLVNAVFSLHSSVLYVIQHNWKVLVFHFVHLALFAGGALVLVPRMGLIGYGVAEVIALPSYAVIHGYLAAQFAAPRYGTVGVWCVAFGTALFVDPLGWWAALGLLAWCCWPGTWSMVSSYSREIRALRHAN